MRSFCLLILLQLIIVSLPAQNTESGGSVVDGVGMYQGLKKVAKTCETCPAEFYVSSSDSLCGNAVKWFTNTKAATNIIDKKDGLVATKALLKWAYRVDIDGNGLFPQLKNYPAGMSGQAAGAIEACFQMNYSNGSLISGTTPANMWYLPAQNELMLMYQYVQKEKSVFGGLFLAQAYWSSTEANAIFAWSTYYPNEYTFTEKSLAFGVRCVRR